LAQSQAYDSGDPRRLCLTVYPFGSKVALQREARPVLVTS